MPHPLDKFTHCPVCGSPLFDDNDEKSRRCRQCGFEYYLNPSSAYVALIYDPQGRLLVLRRSEGMALLLLLMFLAFGNDISRLIH